MDPCIAYPHSGPRWGGAHPDYLWVRSRDKWQFTVRPHTDAQLRVSNSPACFGRRDGNQKASGEHVNCTEVPSKIWTHNLYTGKQTCESLASRFAYFWIEFRCYWIPFFFSTQEKAVKGRETLSDCAKLTWHHAHKVHESRNILDDEVECFWGIKTRTLFQWLFLMSLHCYVIQNLA